MNEELVSVISPCYNGEKYLKPFLDSLLSQDYNNVEFIIINDGSTDNSEKIILSYQERLEKKGWTFKYIFQENKGQAAALNQGLKIFKGKYLMWVDSDDILKQDNIRQKVDFLQKNSKYGMVICKTEVVNENNLNKKIGILKRHVKNLKKDNLFKDLITGYNVYYPPGGYMVTREAFEKSIPEEQIYESKIGQNWQMMLPIAYYYKCGYINKILFTYVVRKGSHSRIENQDKAVLKKINEKENTILTVVKNIDMPEEKKQKYVELVKKIYKEKKIINYYKMNDTKNIKKEFNNIIEQKQRPTVKEKIIYLSTKNKVMKFICKIFYGVIRLGERLYQKVSIYI